MHVNRNERLNARILQLRHSSGPFVNSDQEMVELLKATILVFLSRGSGVNPRIPITHTNLHSSPLITELEVIHTLNCLNPHEVVSPDRLFPKALKALSSHIAPVLGQMLKRSLQTVKVSENWRRGIVTPVTKNPRTTDPRQFRPISLTSVVCKTLETILEEKLMSYLSQLSLLTTRQHGFLRRRSTAANLLSDEVDIICLNFAKAFDSVNHRLLLANLKRHGIAPSVIKWIKCYLRRLSFQVSINGSISQLAEAAN